jgi:hypothetical protein
MNAEKEPESILTNEEAEMAKIAQRCIMKALDC